MALTEIGLQDSSLFSRSIKLNVKTTHSQTPNSVTDGEETALSTACTTEKVLLIETNSYRVRVGHSKQREHNAMRTHSSMSDKASKTPYEHAGLMVNVEHASDETEDCLESSEVDDAPDACSSDGECPSDTVRISSSVTLE